MRYGLDASLAFEPSKGMLLAQCGSPAIEPVEDIEEEVRRALREPLDYPPFSAAVTPGDRVVVTLSDEAPHAAEIVAAVVDSLVESRVDPEAITVLRSDRSPEADPCRLLPDPIRAQVVSLRHAPQEREALAYLATTQHGEAIFLHRAIVDADLVVPIGCFRGNSAAGYHGIHTPIYPTFSDRATVQRFRSTATLDARRRHRKRLAREADEVGWLLGAAFTIQVMPVRGDRVYRVLAGKFDAVRRCGMELYSELWNDHIPRRAALVLAAIEGNASQQTWDNLGRALETAVELVEPGGGLAICTELAALPNAAIGCLKMARSPEEALQHLCREEADDSLAAVQLARALEHCSVYLLSRLDDGLVEDLQMTPVDDAADLVRLANRAESFLLLGNASYAQVTVEDERDE
ncbi:MAG TPA: lactate racemase domain-containing protein [Thermoguttaceae bacterium]|nr:lactate racemase domain-containing protein [Thermoguttaceae bacterium]